MSDSSYSQSPISDVLSRLKAALEGRYEVERELGRGGMATVYLAKDVRHGREVAIKVLHPELTESLGAERFEREIRLAAMLQHPHILGLYDSGVAGNLLYYVMPFVKGESLRDRIDRDGMLPVDEAVAFALEVNDALGYAHSKGVVHRDIKPENVLISEGHALVADFGIARAMSSEGGSAKLTQTGMSLGTPYYMAPEQASGEVVGPTADIYSLGCMLYEMLAGEPPFTGKNAMQIMARHAMETVPSIQIVRSAVPDDVEEAIFAALGKSPADRPQSAAKFAEMLGLMSGVTSTMRARTGPTGVRRIPTGPTGRRAVPWWKHLRVLTAGIIVAVIVAVGGWNYAHKPAVVTSADAHRIAVLYFDDQSRDRSLAALADGLTEGLIRDLSTAPSLTVISRAGAERFRGSEAGVDSVARALRAGFVVRGEVEPEGSDVRVTLRLYDGSGVSLKRESFTKPAASVLAMSDSLTALASDLIKQQLREEIRTSEQRAATSSADAWLLLQRGSQSRKRGDAAAAKGDSIELERSFAAADSLFGAAERVDARWSEPAAQRAFLAYRRSRLAGGDPVQIRKWVDVGIGHADRALALDARNADALETRGNLRYWAWLQNLETDANRRRAQLMGAKDDLEKATTHGRNQAGAYASLSHLYNNVETSTNADVNIAAQRAYEADEFMTNAEDVLYRLFLSSYDLAQFDKAGQWCTAFHARFPASPRSARCQLLLLTARTSKPDVNVAWRLADSAVALTPAPRREAERLNVNMLVAAVIGLASREQPALADSARNVAKRSEGTATIDRTRQLAFIGTFAYLTLGDKDNAFRMLKEYIAANPQQAGGLGDDPGWWFRDLATDPRYAQIVGTAKR